MEGRNGRIVTFYSYKGGTGRSMALANFAWIVAASGKKVLAIDWDLEAPGLHRYFRPFLVDPDLFETDGLIDEFWSFTAKTLATSSTEAKRNTPEAEPDAEDGLSDTARRLDWEFPAGGYIDFIPAGRQSETYSQRVNTFDWRRFYEIGGGRMLTATKDQLRSRYDWVLIDSRTGVSDTSGICTIQMPDIVVAYFTLNRQSIDGVTAILRSIRASRSPSLGGSPINFFPVATRIENAESDRLEIARGYARAILADFLPETMQSSPREYWDKMEISYRPAYAFEEVLAAFGDATGAAGASDTMLSQIEAMSQRITGDQTLRMPEILEDDRIRVLAKYSFGTLPRARKESRVTKDSGDSDFLRRLLVKEQLWRTSQFPWRRLLSRRELDLLSPDDRKGFGRNMTFYLMQSERMQRLLRITDVGGVLTGLLAAAAVLTFYFFAPREIWFFRYRGTPWFAFGIVYSIMAVWVFLVAAASVFAIRDKPHGVRLSEVIKLMMAGPFRKGIRDYSPDEEEKANQ